MNAERPTYDNAQTHDPTLQRLANLMMEMEVDPELDANDPENRGYILAYEIKKPGMPINYGILTLEEAAVFCGAKIAEHKGGEPDDNGDEGLKAMMQGFMEVGATLTETAAREHARKIGKLMLSIELKKRQG